MEELKLVIQMLQGLGETAKEGFIWWLLIDGALPKLLWAAGVGGFIWLGAYIVRKMSADSAAERAAQVEKEGAQNFVKVVRAMLGTDRTEYGYDLDSLSRTLKAFQELVERDKQREAL